jgi:hypothetical protein
LWDDTVARNQAAEDRKWELEQRDAARADAKTKHQWDIEDRMYEVAARDAKAKADGDTNPLKALVDKLGGQTLAKDQINALVEQRLKAGTDRKTFRTSLGWGTHVTSSVPASRERVVEAVGKELGLDPGVLKTFLGTKTEKGTKTLSPQMVRTLRAKPGYAHYARLIQEDIDGLRNNVTHETYVDPATGKTKSRTVKPDLATVKAQIKANLRSDEVYRREPMLIDLLIKDLL